MIKCSTADKRPDLMHNRSRAGATSALQLIKLIKQCLGQNQIRGKIQGNNLFEMLKKSFGSTKERMKVPHREKQHYTKEGGRTRLESCP